MTRRMLIILAGLGSAVILGTAFGFQYIGGLAPCALCLWQRWPHAIAILLGAIGAVVPHRLIAGLGALSMLTDAGIALYHTGIERDWWEGPSTCTSGGNALSGLGGDDLLSMDGPTGVVMCDVVAWEMWGLSMASWNGIACLILAGIWIAALTRGSEARG
ncbi:disulfide bond formation protein B [Rhodobacterales bacterium HKCCE3408]|nr:disulfide bond formation protein B [Rhodobacterales bacterium HKCCE3408]